MENSYALGEDGLKMVLDPEVPIREVWYKMAVNLASDFYYKAVRDGDDYLRNKAELLIGIIKRLY